MQKTIQLLKDKGIIEKIQTNFNQVKPPKGTTDETINECIEFSLRAETVKSEELIDTLIDVWFEDTAEAVRNELNIEFCEEREFAENAKQRIVDIIDRTFKKGQGEK